MPDLTSFYIQKTTTKAEAQARQAARKRVELRWNRDLKHVIDTYEVATPSTIAASLGVNPTPQTPHERTQLRQLYRRLERNAFHGRIRAQYEYSVAQHGEGIPKDRQRKTAGRVWYVSLHTNRKDSAQYEHKGMIAHLRATLDKLDAWELLKTDAQLRDAKPPMVYDLYGRFAGKRLAFEINLSKHPKVIAARCQQWQRYMTDDRYDFPFKADRYLWVVETEERARGIRERWIQEGLTTGQFWVTWQEPFTPYRPESILQAIWLRPDTKEPQAL